jgi:hypothetical protein
VIFIIAARADLYSTKTTSSPSATKKRHIIDLTVDDPPETITNKRARHEVLEDIDKVLPRSIRKARYGTLENTGNNSSRAFSRKTPLEGPEDTEDDLSRAFSHNASDAPEDSEDDLSRDFSRNASDVLEDTEDDLSSLLSKPTKTRQEVQDDLPRASRNARYGDTGGGFLRGFRNESGKIHPRPSNPPDDGVLVIIPGKRPSESRGTSFLPLAFSSCFYARSHTFYHSCRYPQMGSPLLSCCRSPY